MNLLISVGCFGFAGLMLIILGIMGELGMKPRSFFERTMLELGYVPIEQHRRISDALDNTVVALINARVQSSSSEAARKLLLLRVGELEQRLEDTQVDGRKLQRDWMRAMVEELQEAQKRSQEAMDKSLNGFDKSYFSGKAYMAADTARRIRTMLEGTRRDS